MLTGDDDPERGGDTLLDRAGIDGVAVKPATCDVSRAAALPVDRVAVDYEGRDHLPNAEMLTALAAETTLYVTTPVRADGFDPLGDDSLIGRIPTTARRVLVAGHGAYLDESESAKAIAPRVAAARESAPDAWVGTEGIERIALAAGGPQFELLSRSTERDVRTLRAAGFDGVIALYAPTVVTDDEDAVLDAVGDYVARRRPVAKALERENGAESDADGDGSETDTTGSTVTDSTATGRTREILSAAARDFSLVGSPETVRDRVTTLREAGVDHVMGYPARGIDEFLA